MIENQDKKFTKEFSERFKEIVKESGKSLFDLAKDIDVSEAGLHKMLSAGSMKVKTLKKIADVLGQPIAIFLEGDRITQSTKGNYSNNLVNSTFGEPTGLYVREIDSLKVLISQLQSQLADKEKLIKIYERKQK